MKDHEESEFEESDYFDLNSGKEVGIAAATVESDSKQPGERHDMYRTIIWRWRGIQTRTHTHTWFVPLTPNH